ncbi:MAG: PH domain-containing protein [Candidatus Parvarchaeota archaeon]|nr:PH domain-containing protein [Candidatus Rehaiarchaeum fermentans]
MDNQNYFAVHPVFYGKKEFWYGVLFILASVIYEILSLFFFPSLNLSFSFISKYFTFLKFLSSLPLVPFIFLILGFIEIIVADLSSLSEKLILENDKLIFVTGFIIKDRSIILLSKITDIKVQKNILESLIGSGNLVILIQDNEVTS